MPSPHQKLRIIVGGMVGQFPLGGVAWDYFHYVLGLRELGHDVYYHEDTWAWPFDPVKRSPTDDPEYSVRFLGDFFKTVAPDLAERWHYVFLREKHFGMSGEAFAEVARTADVFLNISGACFIPADLNRRCLKVFMDTDPGYNQMLLDQRFSWSENVDRWCQSVAEHDRHLTYAENIYGADCLVPRLKFNWQPTRCVVALAPWSQVRAAPPPPDAPFTTVMTWDWFKGPLVCKGVNYGTKVVEYERFHDLPRHVNFPLALCVGSVKAPWEQIRRDGWIVLDGYERTNTPLGYQQLIGSSAGEWSVAKNIYVATRSGWFSCRTACYLAAGRPAVVQDTAWSRFVPPGDGLVAFNTPQEAIDGLKAVAQDAPRHRAGAYDIAREFLAPDKVLVPMLDSLFAASAGRSAPGVSETPQP